MKKVILKINPETNIIEDIAESYTIIPAGYTEIEIELYPSDLMCQCYRYIDGKILLDKQLYEAFLAERAEMYKNMQ